MNSWHVEKIWLSLSLRYIPPGWLCQPLMAATEVAEVAMSNMEKNCVISMGHIMMHLNQTIGVNDTIKKR